MTENSIEIKTENAGHHLLDPEARAEQYYQSSKTRFLDFLHTFKNWDHYLAYINENRCTPDSLPEILFQKYQRKVSVAFLEGHPFLKRYSPFFSEHSCYLIENEIHIQSLSSKQNGIQLTAEFINISPSEFYYPTIKFICSIHSALHSIGMLLKVLAASELDFKNKGVALYERPATTHPGDEEYVRYICETLEIPLIILKRAENTTFHLQRNRAPKVGKMGRWCSRVFKTEPIKIFYKKYFYPAKERVKFCYTKKFLLNLLKYHNINHPKSLKNADKQTIINYVKAQLRNGFITSKYKYFIEDLFKKTKTSNISNKAII